MRVLLALLLLCATASAFGADSLQAALERHLREDVAWWLDEPRMAALLRDNSARNAALDAGAVAALEQRWQAELLQGDGELTGHVMSRFASKYLAEVVLRMDGAYGNLLVLDMRGLVAAAAELPAHMFFGGDRLVQSLDGSTAPWVLEGRARAGTFARVAMPLADPQSGARIGTVLLEVDAAKLARAGSLRAGSRRRAVDALGTPGDLPGAAAGD